MGFYIVALVLRLIVVSATICKYHEDLSSRGTSLKDGTRGCVFSKLDQTTCLSDFNPVL